MDVDSLTREVVSCIISSMDFIDSPPVVESQMCSNVVIASPPQSSCLLKASKISLDSADERDNMGTSILYQMESSKWNINLDLCHMESCGSKPSVDVCSKILRKWYKMQRNTIKDDKIVDRCRRNSSRHRNRHC